MSEMTLESLGFTKEELQERAVEFVASKVLRGVSYDEDGESCVVDSKFSYKLNQRIAKHVDDTINAIAEKHILGKVSSYIEEMCLQETNKWGEKTGKSLTFVEYLVARAEAYLQETVNYEGKAKSEAGSYSWSGQQTRLVWLVHEHLQHNINRAMSKAVKSANEQIAQGIAKTVELQMIEISEKIKMKVSVKEVN